MSKKTSQAPVADLADTRRAKSQDKSNRRPRAETQQAPVSPEMSIATGRKKILSQRVRGILRDVLVEYTWPQDELRTRREALSAIRTVVRARGRTGLNNLWKLRYEIEDALNPPIECDYFEGEVLARMEAIKEKLSCEALESSTPLTFTLQELNDLMLGVEGAVEWSEWNVEHHADHLAALGEGPHVRATADELDLIKALLCYPIASAPNKTAAIAACMTVGMDEFDANWVTCLSLAVGFIANIRREGGTSGST